MRQTLERDQQQDALALLCPRAIRVLQVEQRLLLECQDALDALAAHNDGHVAAHIVAQFLLDFAQPHTVDGHFTHQAAEAETRETTATLAELLQNIVCWPFANCVMRIYFTRISSGVMLVRFCLRFEITN